MGAGACDGARRRHTLLVRLSLTTAAPLPPQRIFVEWQKLCLKTCDDDVRDYWICRQEAGLMTPLRCQPQNTVMQACLSVCTNDEANFRVYKARRLDEIEALALGRSETLAAAPKPGAGQ